MIPEVLNNYSNIVISTGNVLSVIKKAGQKPTEELIDCLKSTLVEPEINETAQQQKSKKPNIIRQNDDLVDKINENERQHVKIGAKIFLNRNCEENLKSAIDNLFNVLNIDYLDNLILAYHPKLDYGKKITNGDSNNHALINGDNKEGIIEWGGGDNNALTDLKKLWKSLEKFSFEKKIEQLGIADLDYDSLKELFSTCEVFPTIAQINLSTCCIVPPALQAFCNENDIQLLTHSDPEEILTKTVLNDDLNIPSYHPSWIIRYQVHVKCRGVLTAKGFIVGIGKD